MEEKILASIDKKLDAIVRLLANKAIEGKSNKTEAIIALGALGVDPNIIAEIVDTTPGTVYTRLAEAKRKRKTMTRKVKREAESDE
jgi:DNA-directed RNA polymerase specialized sigma24 family protein